MAKRGRLDVEAIRSRATEHGDTTNKAIKPRSRDKKAQLSAWIDPEVRKRIKVLAAEEDVSVESLVEEALHDLLRKRGGS